MKPGACLRAVAALVTALSFAGAALADGVPVMPWHNGGQQRPGLAADGAGGAWLVFKTDTVTSGIVHLTGSGLADPGWPNGIFDTGLEVTYGAAAQVLANSPDRVIVLADYCAYERLVTSYDTTGDTSAGFPASVALDYPRPQAVLGTDGRVLAAVTAAWGGGGRGVRFAIVSSAGQLLAEAEVPMNFQAIAPEPFKVVPDGAGGMIVGVPIYYASDYSTGMDLALLRIAADGTRPWGDGGKVVTAANANQTDIHLWPDGAGGALVTWTDARTGGNPFDIYAARFTSAGVLAAGWTSHGKKVGSAAGAQMNSRVVDDTGGGAWILWRDERVADIDLYFTHVQGSGAFAVGFAFAGTLLCGATGSATDVQMVPDGAGGFFAVWLDPRDGEADLYGTHITAAGTPAAGWPAGGLALCDDPAQQLHPALVATGVGKAIVAWTDLRDAPGHVYALGLEENGPVTAVLPGPGPALRLRAAANPSFGLSDLWLAAPAGERVEVKLFDVAGRVLRSTSVAGIGAETRVRLAGGPLPAGLYFASARQGARRATVRICVLQ